MPKTHVVLTPAESKRLIAQAVAQMKPVKKALTDGIIVIATGTTNTYVLEAITGQDLQQHEYITGVTTPAHSTREIPDDRKADLVLRQGIPDQSLDRFSALDHMKPGDVYIKGANALNYAEKQAGILIGGHGGGGTIGGAWGHIIGRRLHFILPIGLEKCVAHDINGIARKLNSPDTFDPDPPRLMPVYGHIITEIEAFEILCDVTGYHIASGGVAGAEGAVRLLLEGTGAALANVREKMAEIQGEPPFLG